MQKFIPGDSDLPSLKAAAALLASANKALAAAKKESDAAKQTIADWLEKSRQTKIDNLEVGEIIIVEGICMIERSSQNRFDEASFRVKNPALYAEFKKELAISKFKPLL